MDQDACVFEHWLLRHALYQSLVELLFVVLFNEHYVDLVFQVVVGFLFYVFIQKHDPLLDIAHVFVGWNHFCKIIRIFTNLLVQVFENPEWLRRSVWNSLYSCDSANYKLKALISLISSKGTEGRKGFEIFEFKLHKRDVLIIRLVDKRLRADIKFS